MKIAGDLHRQVVALRRYLPRFAAASRTSVKARSIGGRLRASFRGGDEGQALVEFAVVLPLLLLLMTGVFWFGIALYNYQQMCAAVSQGVVALAEGQNIGTNPCTNAVTIVTTDTQGMIPNNNSLSVTIYEGGSAIAAASCATTLPSGTQVEMLATYQYTLPIVGASFTNCCTLATAEILTTP
jgi:Flp pilus assembly protein TadG